MRMVWLGPAAIAGFWGGPSATLGAPTNVPDPGPAPPGIAGFWGGPSATLGAPTNVPEPGPAPPGSVRVDGAPDTAWDQRLFTSLQHDLVQYNQAAASAT